MNIYTITFPCMASLKRVIILFILVHFAINGNATVPSQQFEAGNKEYRFGNYEKAIGIYEKLVKDGFRSSTLYFNLGNSYYKESNYAKSIINYERALKLNPQDEDIQFNLRLANMNTVDKIEPLPRLFYEQWWDSFISMFSSDTWSKLGIAGCWLTLLFAGIYLFSQTVFLKKTGFFGGLICCIAATTLLLVGRIQYQRVYGHKAAVIIETSAYIKSSPEEKSTNLFMLHAGTKIEVVDELQDWKKIKIANGNIGWISNKDLEMI